jgi:dipeptidase
MKTNLLFLFLFLFSFACFACFACSTFIAGNQATSDGSVIIARNVDWEDPFMPFNMKFYTKNGDSAPYFAFPRYSPTEENLSWEETALNSNGVAISTTETIFSRAELIGPASPLDPLTNPAVKGSISEADITSILLPYITSAKQGALLLGEEIEAYGSSEGFGVAFANKGECWYLENAGGTHWLAQRIPDDCYFFSANQGRLPGSTDLSDHSKILASDDIITFAKKNGFCTSNKDFNFAKSYMDQSEPLNEDYNKCRVDRAITIVSKGKTEDTVFIKVPPKTITIGTVKMVLRDHYFDKNNPSADPYFGKHPDYPQRPISVIRCSLSHITQMGRHYSDGTSMPPAIGNVMYVAYGFTDLSVYIPFYQGLISEDGTDCYIPKAYQGATSKIDNKSMFWLLRKLQTLVMMDYPKNASYVKQTITKIESHIKKRQKHMERKYRTQYNPSNPDNTRHLIINFTKHSVWKIKKELRKLIHKLNKKYKFHHKQFHSQLKAIGEKYNFEGA